MDQPRPLQRAGPAKADGLHLPRAKNFPQLGAGQSRKRAERASLWKADELRFLRDCGVRRCRDYRGRCVSRPARLQ